MPPFYLSAECSITFARLLSTVNVSGGIIRGGLVAFGASTVNVTGGTSRGLGTSSTSTLDLFGTGFTKTFLADEGAFQQYTVLGTLQNGDALNAVYGDKGGTLEFNGIPVNPVPEASPVVSLGLLLLLGAGGAVSRKRKVGAAG